MISRRKAIQLGVAGLTFSTLTACGNESEASSIDEATTTIYKGNPARTGANPGPGPDPTRPIVTKWEFELGTLARTTPVYADGVVYVGSSNNNVHALDAASGMEIWRFPTQDIIRSHLTLHDGVLTVMDRDEILYAIDVETASERWQTRAGGLVASPIIQGGVVYVGGRALRALEFETGEPKWEYERPRTFFSAPAMANGILYSRTADRELYAIDASTGEEVWVIKAGGSEYSVPTVNEGRVFTCSNGVYAYDTTDGKELWKISLERAPQGNDYKRPSVAAQDGRLFFGGTDSAVHCLDAETGETVWRTKTSTRGAAQSSVALCEGVVYYGGHGSTLIAYDMESGEELWKYSAEGDEYGFLDGTPIIVDGVIYYPGRTHMYALANEND